MSDDGMRLVLSALADLSNDVGGLKTDLGRIEIGLGARLDRVEARLDRLEARQDRLEENLTRYRTDLMERMDRLGNEITLIRDDISVNMGAVNHVRTSNVATRDQVRSLEEIVATMTRQIFRLETDVRQLRGQA